MGRVRLRVRRQPSLLLPEEAGEEILFEGAGEEILLLLEEAGEEVWSST